MSEYLITVLNPHGSDETINDELYYIDIEKKKLRVLNPHGSDETIMFKVQAWRFKIVLNPHGSDETSY